MGLQWAIYIASEQTGPRKALPTTSSCRMGFRIAPSNLSELIDFKLTYIFKYEQIYRTLCQSEHHRHLIHTLSHVHAFRRIQLNGSQRESLKISAQWSVQSARIVGMNILITIQYGVAQIHPPEDIIDLC